MQLGKMYLVKEHCWFMFPTKELAALTLPLRSSAGAQAEDHAKWFGERYNCNVSFVEENTCFVLLEVDDNHFKLLDSNGNIGWISCSDFSRYFKLVKE